MRPLTLDDQLGLGDLLHREVGWFGTLQDFVHVSGSAIFPWYDWQTLKGVIGIDGTKTPTFYALRLMIRGLQGEDPLSGGARYPQPGGYLAHYGRG